MATLAVADVGVRFGKVFALDDVSVDFRAGVNGVLGPNGAGKTTLFRVMIGALQPTAGVLSWSGIPVRGSRSLARYQTQVGYLPQDPGWFEGFTAVELCAYIGALRGVPRRLRIDRARSALDAVKLGKKADIRLSRLSGGQRRRAFIAQAMVHDPQILVLDEPTSGLDPVQRIRLRELIAELGQDKTILLSTHLVEDVAHISQHVVILDTGHVVWNGPPTELARMGEAGVKKSGTALTSYERGFLNALESEQV